VNRNVIITAVCDRREHLAKLLNELAAQTVRPDQVIVLADGHWGAPPKLELSYPFKLDLRLDGPGSERKGPPARWRKALELADHRHPNRMVFTLDDDVSIGSTYIEQSERIVIENGGMCSWHPLTAEETEGKHGNAVIPICAGGFAAFYAQWLTGMASHPRAAHHLQFGRLTDPFVSFWLWRRGIPVLRPYAWQDVVSFVDTPVLYDVGEQRAELRDTISDLIDEGFDPWGPQWR